MRSGRAASWSWAPIRRRSRSPATAGSSPSTATVPPSARRTPWRISTVVVLPAPFVPSRPNSSPSSTAKEIAVEHRRSSRSASPRPRTEMTGAGRARSRRAGRAAWPVVVVAWADRAPGGCRRRIGPWGRARPRPRVGVDDAVVVGEHDGCGPVAHAEFGEDGADVALDRGLARRRGRCRSRCWWRPGPCGAARRAPARSGASTRPPAPGGGARWPGTASSTRGATFGSSQAAPRATARVAAIRSSAEVSLRTNPAAPASSAPHRASSSSKVVRMSTGGPVGDRLAASGWR